MTRRAPKAHRKRNGQRSSWRAVRCLSRPVSHGIPSRKRAAVVAIGRTSSPRGSRLA